MLCPQGQARTQAARLSNVRGPAQSHSRLQQASVFGPQNAATLLCSIPIFRPTSYKWWKSSDKRQLAAIINQLHSATPSQSRRVHKLLDSVFTGTGNDEVGSSILPCGTIFSFRSAVCTGPCRPARCQLDHDRPHGQAAGTTRCPIIHRHCRAWRRADQ